MINQSNINNLVTSTFEDAQKNDSSKKKKKSTFIRFSIISLLFTATSTTIQRLNRPAWLCKRTIFISLNIKYISGKLTSSKWKFPVRDLIKSKMTKNFEPISLSRDCFLPNLIYCLMAHYFSQVTHNKNWQKLTQLANCSSKSTEIISPESKLPDMPPIRRTCYPTIPMHVHVRECWHHLIRILYTRNIKTNRMHQATENSPSYKVSGNYLEQRVIIPFTLISPCFLLF